MPAEISPKPAISPRASPTTARKFICVCCSLSVNITMGWRPCKPLTLVLRLQPAMSRAKALALSSARVMLRSTRHTIKPTSASSATAWAASTSVPLQPITPGNSPASTTKASNPAMRWVMLVRCQRPSKSRHPTQRTRPACKRKVTRPDSRSWCMRRYKASAWSICARVGLARTDI